MHFCLQIPVIDLSQLSGNSSPNVVWPNPEMSKDERREFLSRRPFITNFGKVQSDSRGYFCNINCLRFVNLTSIGTSINDRESVIFNVTKRIYSECIYVKTLDFAFSDPLEAVLDSTSGKRIEITKILEHYISMPVNIMDLSSHQTVRSTLGAASDLLSSNYAVSIHKTNMPALEDKTVIHGDACIILTYALDKKAIFPSNAKLVDKFVINKKIVKLYGYKWSMGERTYKVWSFQLPSLEDLTSPLMKTELEKRRMNLFRLNAEKESVRILIDSLPRENNHHSLEKYLKKTPEKIFKKKRFSSTQDRLRKFALENNIEESQFMTKEDIKKMLDGYGLDNLKKMEDKMKPQKKVVLFITSNPEETSIINYGEQFKKINSAWQSGSDRAYFQLLPIEPAVEREKLMEILYKGVPDYLHITLHASNDIKGLYFQDSDRKPDPMSVDEFADCIKNFTELNKIPEAIILCACHSLTHAQAVKNYCKYAMGTNYVFPDKAAIIYAYNFYNALFNGKDVSFCHKTAIHSIRYNKPRFDPIDGKEVHDIPQLLL